MRQDVSYQRFRKRWRWVWVGSEGRGEEPSVVVEAERGSVEFPCAVTCVEARWGDVYP